MQGDNKNLGAEELAPVLLEVSFEDPELVEARALLEDWDYQQHMDSPAAALFNVFWKHLLIETFMDELPEDMIPSGNDRWFIVMRSLVADPTNRWWDDQNTEDVETMEDIFRTAFTAAVKDMKKAQGDDPAEWNWGGLHTFYLSHDVMGNFPLLNKAFERGPFPVSGGSSIVNATGWSAASDGYQVSGGVPSFRMIVDLGELSNSLVIYPTGQSGHPYHTHYIDMIDLWRNIEYISMLWDLEDVQEEVEGHLRLVP
jgi:penicillin amidase